MKPKWAKIGQQSWRVTRGNHSLVMIRQKDGTVQVDNPELGTTLFKGLNWEQSKLGALMALESYATARPSCPLCGGTSIPFPEEHEKMSRDEIKRKVQAALDNYYAMLNDGPHDETEEKMIFDDFLDQLKEIFGLKT